MLTRMVFHSLTLKGGGAFFYTTYPHQLNSLFIVVKCWGKVKCLYTEQLTTGCWDKNISQGFIPQRKKNPTTTKPTLDEIFKMKTTKVVKQSEKLPVSLIPWRGLLQKIKDRGDLPEHVPPRSSERAVARATPSSSSPIPSELLHPVTDTVFKQLILISLCSFLRNYFKTKTLVLFWLRAEVNFSNPFTLPPSKNCMWKNSHVPYKREAEFGSISIC